MTLKSKICGVSDSKTLSYLINHSYPPNFVGFIVNYLKSRRYVQLEKLKELLKIDKKESQFVAVLVNPNHSILEEIKDLPFDYYQLYNCDPEQIRSIKVCIFFLILPLVIGLPITNQLLPFLKACFGDKVLF